MATFTTLICVPALSKLWGNVGKRTGNYGKQMGVFSQWPIAFCFRILFEASQPMQSAYTLLVEIGHEPPQLVDIVALLPDHHVVCDITGPGYGCAPTASTRSGSAGQLERCPENL